MSQPRRDEMQGWEAFSPIEPTTSHPFTHYNPADPEAYFCSQRVTYEDRVNTRSAANDTPTTLRSAAARLDPQHEYEKRLFSAYALNPEPPHVSHDPPEYEPNQGDDWDEAATMPVTRSDANKVTLTSGELQLIQEMRADSTRRLSIASDSNLPTSHQRLYSHTRHAYTPRQPQHDLDTAAGRRAMGLLNRNDALARELLRQQPVIPSTRVGENQDDVELYRSLGTPAAQCATQGYIPPDQGDSRRQSVASGTNPLNELSNMTHTLGVMKLCHRMLNSLFSPAAYTPESVQLTQKERAELRYYREQSYMHASSGAPSLSDSGYISTSSMSDDNVEHVDMSAPRTNPLQSLSPSPTVPIDNYDKISAVSASSANQPTPGPPPLDWALDQHDHRSATSAIAPQYSSPSLTALNDNYDKMSANQPTPGPPPLDWALDHHDHGSATSAVSASSANRPPLCQPPLLAHIDNYDRISAISAPWSIPVPPPPVIPSNHDFYKSSVRATSPAVAMHSPRQSVRSVLPPPTFDGENWESFQLQFAACADANDWDNDYRLKVLQASLRGNAVFILYRKPTDREWTYTSLLAHLNQRYGVNEVKIMQRAVLAQTKQSPDQSIHEYADTLYRRAIRVDTNAKERDYMVLSAFLDGINDPEMAQFLKLATVKHTTPVRTMSDAVTLALHYEAARGYKRPCDEPLNVVSNALRDLSGPYVNRKASRAREWSNNRKVAATARPYMNSPVPGCQRWRQ